MNLPTLDVAKAAIAPYTLAIKVGLAVALLVAVLVFAWRVSVWREGWQARAVAVAEAVAARDALADERDCLKGTTCADRVDRLATDGAAAVETARQAAQDRAREEQARIAADGQAAVQRAEAKASVAAVRLREVEARYRAALSTPESGCAEQAREPLKCPLR